MTPWLWMCITRHEILEITTDFTGPALDWRGHSGVLEQNR
jgi:hypothetical protein